MAVPKSQVKPVAHFSTSTGQGSAEPLEIGAKAMEAVKSLEAQP
jgi:hypothetical protein